MTARKPPGVPFQTWIDQQIKKAEDEGEFDDLPGKGKPIVNPTATYDPDWWAKKWVKRERISVLPPALELRRKVERELEGLARLRHERDVRGKIEALNVEIRSVNRSAVSGPMTSIAPLDVDEVVGRWKAERSE